MSCPLFGIPLQLLLHERTLYSPLGLKKGGWGDGDKLREREREGGKGREINSLSERTSEGGIKVEAGAERGNDYVDKQWRWKKKQSGAEETERQKERPGETKKRTRGRETEMVQLAPSFIHYSSTSRNETCRGPCAWMVSCFSCSFRNKKPLGKDICKEADEVQECEEAVMIHSGACIDYTPNEHTLHANFLPGSSRANTTVRVRSVNTSIAITRRCWATWGPSHCRKSRTACDKPWHSTPLGLPSWAFFRTRMPTKSPPQRSIWNLAKKILFVFV